MLGGELEKCLGYHQMGNKLLHQVASQAPSPLPPSWYGDSDPAVLQGRWSPPWLQPCCCFHCVQLIVHVKLSKLCPINYASAPLCQQRLSGRVGVGPRQGFITRLLMISRTITFSKVQALLRRHEDPALALVGRQVHLPDKCIHVDQTSSHLQNALD